jgi:hypothetical protein
MISQSALRVMDRAWVNAHTNAHRKPTKKPQEDKDIREPFNPGMWARDPKSGRLMRDPVPAEDSSSAVEIPALCQETGTRVAEETHPEVQSSREDMTHKHQTGWTKKHHYMNLGWCWCGQSCPCCRANVGDTLGACEICIRDKDKKKH